MRLLVPALFVPLLLLGSASTGAPPSPAAAATAPNAARFKVPGSSGFAQCLPGPVAAQSPPKAERPQKLGELPPGQVYLTVVRTIGGCPVPAMSQVRVGR
jgi:hypothetical protein